MFTFGPNEVETKQMLGFYSIIYLILHLTLQVLFRKPLFSFKYEFLKFGNFVAF